MIKFYYPNGTHCYRALHTFHAVYVADDGRLIFWDSATGDDEAADIWNLDSGESILTVADELEPKTDKTTGDDQKYWQIFFSPAPFESQSKNGRG